MIRNCLAILVLVLIGDVCLAHSGRTDANGGHFDRRRGGYHVHNSGYSVRSYYPRKSSRTRYRSTYSRSARTKSSKKPRRTARVRPTPKAELFANCEYVELDPDATQASKKDKSDFALLESTYAHRKRDDKYPRIFFVIYGDFSKRDLSTKCPTSEQLKDLTSQLKIRGREVKFFLNGMSKFKHCWAYGKPIDDKTYGIWIRDANVTEFTAKPVGILTEFRWWHSKKKTFKMFAAFVSLDKDKRFVELVKENGETMFVDRFQLCIQDNDYIDAQSPE